MNQTIKAEWLEALRSGEYVQGAGALQTEDGKFCCLGVLCDLAVKRDIIPEPVLSDPGVEWGDAQYQYGGEKNPGTLPGEVEEWAELSDPNPSVADGTGIPAPLSDWNDEREADFSTIARLIEENL